MGRLLRKKPSFSSKKKGSDAEMVESSPAADGSAVKNAVPSPALSAAEKKRRPVAIQQLPKAPPRAYPGRELLEKTVQFLREVKVELRKVTWPSRKQTVGSTVVVIVLVMIIALFLGVVDVGLSKLAQVLLQ